MKRSAMNIAVLAALAFGAGAAPRARALDPRNPDWPCQQLKVPHVSLASVWNGPPLDDVAKAPAAQPAPADLVARLAARRTPMTQADKLIRDYLAGTAAEKQDKAKRLFAALFDTLNAERDQVLNGIERFSRKQKALAADIREQTQKLQEMQAAPNADQAAIASLGTRLEWETRIFDDRRKTTSYVCEVPTLIEKRLFDLGRSIQQAMR